MAANSNIAWTDATHDLASNLPLASYVQSSVCEHGTVHLFLLDENRTPFSALVLPREMFTAVIADVARQYRELGYPGLPILDEETKH